VETVDGSEYTVVYEIFPTSLDLITFDAEKMEIVGNEEQLTGVNYIDAWVTAPNHVTGHHRFVIHVNNKTDVSDSIDFTAWDAADMPVYDGTYHRLSEFVSEATSSMGAVRYQLDGVDIDSLDSATITDVGDHTISAIYEDETNYGIQSVTVSLKPQEIDVSEWIWDYDEEEPPVYNETPYSVTLSDDNPGYENVDVYYTGDEGVVNAGSYITTAVLTINNDNYILVGAGENNELTLNWTIAKADGLEKVIEEPYYYRYTNTQEVIVSAESLYHNDDDIVITNVTISMQDGILAKVELNDEGNVVYCLREGLTSENVGERVDIIITFDSRNYEGNTQTITVEVIDKEDVGGSIRFTGGSATYNGIHQQPKSATISGVKASGNVSWTYRFEKVEADETVSVDEMVDVGSYLVYAIYEDDDHYGVSDPVAFDIKPKSISISGAIIADTVYDGDILLDPENVTGVMFSGLIGEDTVEYTVVHAEYKDPNAGSKTVTIEVELVAGGNYTFAKGNTAVYSKAKGNILKRDITVTVEQIEEQYYTGKELKPAVVVKDGDTVLVEGTDYKLTYANNTDVGTAAVTIICSSKNVNFTTDEPVSFEILPAEVTLAAISDLVVAYSGAVPDASKIKATVKFGTKSVPGVWSWEYAPGVDAGVYSVTATFTPTDTTNLKPLEGVELDVCIEPAVISISGAVVEPKEFDEDKTLDPSYVTEVTFKGATLDRDDYVVRSAEFKDAKVGNNKAVTITVELLNDNWTFAKNENIATYSAKGSITGKHVVINVEGLPADKDGDDLPELPYTGSKVVFDALVIKGTDSSSEEHELIANVDYKVSYADNTNIGEGAYATITSAGTNYYFEPYTILFEIREPEAEDFVVALTPVNVVYSGKALTTSVIKGTVTLGGKKMTGKWNWAAETELVDAGDYEVEVVFTLSGQYADYGPLVAKVPVTIAPKVITVKAATVVKEYRDEIDEAEINVVFSGMIKGDEVAYIASACGDFEDGNVGKNKAISVAVKVTDANYCFANGETEIIFESKGEVLRKTVDVVVEELSSEVYTGEKFTPELDVEFIADGLPVEVDYTVTYKNNQNAGTATVTLTCKDTNYFFDTQILTFEIEPIIVDSGDIVLDDIITVYSGKVPAATLINAAVLDKNGKALKGKWTWKTEPGVNAGDYEAVAQFVLSDKNYAVEPVSVTVIVKQKEVTLSSVKLAKREYSEGDTTAEVSAVTFKGAVSKDVVDYTVTDASYSDDNVGRSKPATITVELAEDGNYIFANGTNVDTYTNAKGEITKKKLVVSVSGIPESENYIGEPVTFDVELTADNIELKADVDFKVTYKNNTRVGKATVTITCISPNYTFDKITQTFQIVNP